jgi:hypothetical protein
MIASLPLAVALSVLFAGAGALTLVCPPGPAARFAQPAMSAAMLAMTWARPGPLVQSGPAVLVAGCCALEVARRSGPDGVARVLTAVASVWMLAIPASGPGWIATAGPAAGLLATSAFWTTRALRHRPGRRADAGCHALMGAGMTTMLLAMTAGW